MADLFAETSIITLNSKYANEISSAGFKNDVRFDFTNLLKDLPFIVYNTISIESATIPYSFYNINETNNLLVIRTTTSGAGTNTHTLTITKGNYNAVNFQTELLRQYTIETAGSVAIMGVNRATGVFTLTPATSTPQISQIELLTTGSTIFETIGLFKSNHVFTFNLTTPTSFDFPANFLGPTKLHIYSNTLASNNVDSRNAGINSLIGIVPVNAATFGLITYEISQHIESVLKSRYINDIDIRITDENDNAINFNYIDWTITLILKTFKYMPEVFKERQQIDMAPSKKLEINEDMIKREQGLDIKQINKEIKQDKKEYNEGDNKKVIVSKKPLIIPDFDDADLLME